MEQAQSSFRLYSRIAEQIAAAIAAGAPTFEMPWHRPNLSFPANAATCLYYRGINVLSLWVAAQLRGYGTNYWATYRQWSDLGAQVRHAEKGTAILFYRELEQDTDDDEAPAKRLVARAFFVFNADQVDNWRPPDPLPALGLAVAIDHAEQFVRSIGADIRASAGTACYIPDADYILMPHRELFVGSTTSSPTESYYATLFHELVHWTGHASRIARTFAKRFGDEAYAMEELVAELGAAFLCAEQKIANAPRPDHAAYVAGWLRVLGNDPRAIVTAASAASAAAQYLNSQR